MTIKYLAAVIVLLCLCIQHVLPESDCYASEKKEAHLLFTGDIMLSRNVKFEIENRKTNPWNSLGSLLKRSDLTFGNIEGAVGKPEDCLQTSITSPCFSIDESFIPLLWKAGFRMMSVQNNHNSDLGEKGRRSTMEALEKSGIEGLSFDASPHFIQLKGITIAIIPINMIPGRDKLSQNIPSTELSQKLRLADNLANISIVYVHWGSELLDWPDKKQRENAEWMIRNGADLIIGHHPHVIQSPEMISGRPVFFSLGNHVFDQKYPVTKDGLIADCRITEKFLDCRAIVTHTPEGSFFPVSVEEKKYNLEPVPIKSTIQISGFDLHAVNSTSDGKHAIIIEAAKNGKKAWQSRPIRLASVSKGRLDSENEYLFTLECHYSTIDKETGLRPYVYSVTEKGLVSKWRGSALAFPLLDAKILPGDEKILCALHRGDSFIAPKPDSSQKQIAAYRWNGFGFSGIEDHEAVEKCRKCFE